MSVPQQTLDAFIALAKKELGKDVHYWHRGTTYDVETTKTVISAVDAFIVILPSNVFKHNISTLPSGTRSELTYAIAFKESWNHGEKHIFIGYMAGANRTPTFYSANHDMSPIGRLIEGVAGTSRNFTDYCSNYKTKTAEQAHEELEEMFLANSKGQRGKTRILMSQIITATGLTKQQIKERINFYQEKGGWKLVEKWFKTIGLMPNFGPEIPLPEYIVTVQNNCAIALQNEEYDKRILLLRVQ